MEKIITKKIIDRYNLGEVPKPNIWYNYKGDKRKWSIMNVGELHKNDPYKAVREYFKFWEAMSLDGKREIIRADTLEELIDKIKKYEKNNS